MATKILQGDPPLIKVCIDPLTEDNNPNFARGSLTKLFFFISLVQVVSVPLTAGNNWNFARGSPTDLSIFLCGFFGQRDRIATRQDWVV